MSYSEVSPRSYLCSAIFGVFQTHMLTPFRVPNMVIMQYISMFFSGFILSG